MRNVAYLVVPESKLRKWAIIKPEPNVSKSAERIHVLIEVEGENVFCATAINGPAQKQRSAVEMAMQWKFKKDRGDNNSSVAGTLTFSF